MTESLPSIRGEKNPFTFYLLPILISSICIEAGILMIVYSLKGNFVQKTGNDGVQLVVGLVLIFAGVAYTNARFQHTKSIYIDNEKVLIGNRLFLIEQVKKIELTRRKALTFFSPNGSVTIFILNNGTRHIFFDKLYRNAYDLKQFIELHYGSVVEGFSATYPESPPSEEFETFYIFKGNLMVNWRFYMLLFFLIVFIKAGFFSLDFDNIPGVIFGIPMLIVLIGVFWQFNYFELSSQTLVVKKFIPFIFSRRYKLREIREAVFESGDRQPRSVRIIMRNFSNKVFHAPTLLTTDWIEFKKALESEGVTVRTENIN
jgi:hypothetical protein